MKSDAEIYAEARKRRWPYVDEVRQDSADRKPKRGGDAVAATIQPKPVAPSAAEAVAE